MKRIQVEKEDIKLSLFIDSMILYLIDPTYSTRKLLDLVNIPIKIVGYKINM